MYSDGILKNRIEKNSAENTLKVPRDFQSSDNVSFSSSSIFRDVSYRSDFRDFNDTAEMFQTFLVRSFFRSVSESRKSRLRRSFL
jgi:hypothetical protein